MIHICPTVTATNPHLYRAEIERVSGFAKRLHIDIADDVFTPVSLVPPAQLWFPEAIEIDIHVMLQEPAKELETLLALRPARIVLHAESKGDLAGMLAQIQDFGIVPGIALLAETQPSDHLAVLKIAQHILLFGGRLGYHGGSANMGVLSKVPLIKSINAEAELAWDGGINDENTKELIDAGISVLNVGGFIQKAEDPQAAYAILNAIANNG